MQVHPEALSHPKAGVRPSSSRLQQAADSLATLEIQEHPPPMAHPLTTMVHHQARPPTAKRLALHPTMLLLERHMERLEVSSL